MRFSDTAVEESAEYYSWQVPDKPVDVRISAEAIDRILADAIRGLGLLPRRGVEVGGLLLGTADAAGGISVSVDDILAIPTEYAFGPSYSLSEKDKDNLRAVLRQWERSPGRPAYPVGFYRTQTHDGLSLTPEDQELFSAYFPDPSSVVLLIRPQPLGSSVAGLFFREGGEVRAESSYLEFPVRPRGLRKASDVPAPPQPEPPKPQSKPAAPAAEPAPRWRQPLWASWWVQLPILIGLLLVDGFMGYLAAAQVRPAPAPAQRAPRNPYALSLLVVEYGQNLHLTWDRDAPALASAISAVLSITDGSQTRSLDLSASQLRAGSVIYRRVTSRVSFRLEVLLRDKRAVSETWDLAPLP